MSDFMLEEVGETGLYAVFHQDAGEGFFFLYRKEDSEVLAQERVYDHEPSPPISERDVQIFWRHENEASLVIRGENLCRLEVPVAASRGATRNSKAVMPSDANNAIRDEFLSNFIEARQKYWKSKAD